MHYCEAEKYCADSGGRLVADDFAKALAYIQSKNENRLFFGITFLNSDRSNSATNNWRQSWGSAFSTANEADKVFINSSWGGGEPNDMGRNEDCVLLSNAKLNDVKCSRKWDKMICEKRDFFLEHSRGKSPMANSTNEPPCMNFDSAHSIADCVEKYVILA